MLPLAEWKHLKGFDVEIARLSETGETPPDIKAYLQNAHDTWPDPPDYVVLVGDTDYLSTVNGSDDYYAQLDGDDYLTDVHIGRLSADSVEDCDLIVAKTLAHERTPYTNDPGWFRSACLVVREDYDASDAIYFEDTWFAHDLMTDAGFARIDTFFRRNSSGRDDVHAAVTEGRSFINYRGQGTYNWWAPFNCDPEMTAPSGGLPIVMSATCGTGKFDSDGYACEEWMRAGTPESPKGAVAFCGSSVFDSPVAELRSAVNQGFYAAIFDGGARTLGEAFEAGRLNLHALYDNETEYAGWNIQGDPALPIWTAVPESPDVSHDLTVPNGPSEIVVNVALSGLPVEGAMVCASSLEEVHTAGLTDENGDVALEIVPVTADTVLITVTGQNLYPYEGHIIVTATRPHLVYSDHSHDDSATGNGDGHVGPGETVRLSVTLRNAGPGEATDVAATLRSSDALVAMGDTTAGYGSIPGGGSSEGSVPFTLTVAQDCPNGHELALEIVATDSSGTTWHIPVPDVSVSAAQLELLAIAVDDSEPGGDGDGTVESGETAGLTMTIRNAGAITVTDAEAVLSSLDPMVAVTHCSSSLDTIPGDGQSVASGFRISVSPTAPPGRESGVTLGVSGEAATYWHAQILEGGLTLGGNAEAGPTGPDTYGYYAYDSGDTLSGQAPLFEWIDISGIAPTITEITDADAGTVTLGLPFTFRYYGIDYDDISVCSNGFVAMGAEDYRFGDNSPIPDQHGPAAMIAPLWDDLDPSTGGDIYQWHDEIRGRWICQFDSVARFLEPGTETFQVILLDPAVHATSTGDGEILLQYESLSDTDEATVGIEDASQSDGLEYLYNAGYDQAAASLAAGLAVRFTTTPAAPPSIWLAVAGSSVDDTEQGDGDGLPEPGEEIEFVLTLRNMGSVVAENIRATLSSADEDISLDIGSVDFPNIPPGESSDNASSPFTLRVAASPSDENVELIATIGAGQYETSDRLVLTLNLAGETPDARFSLHQNSPNPFTRATTIGFSLDRPGRASIDVFDVSGRKIATLLDASLPEGPASTGWNGTDAAGRRVSAGIYFYRLKAGSRVSFRKLVLLR